MSDLRFTKTHEWVRLDGDIATVGISTNAQEQLGDVVYVELPEAGKAVEKAKEAAVVESVKAASEVYAPLTGTVAEANPRLTDQPGLVNEDAEGEGWFFKIKLSNPSELDDLLDEAAYRAIAAEAH